MVHCKCTASPQVCILNHEFVYPVGNGRSQGDKVYVETFNTYVQDVVGHVQDMTAEYPGVPSILMGHSMVSVPCNRAAQGCPFKVVITLY